MNCEEFFKLANRINKKVCLFGAGEIGSFWGYEIIKCLGLEIECYIDNRKSGKCNGLVIHDFKWLESNKEKFFIFVVVEGKPGYEICESLNQACIKDYYWLCKWDDSWLSDICEYILDTDNEELRDKFDGFINDKKYLTNRFERRMGYKPDFDNPITFNEKINWLKLNDRKSIYSKMVDKYAVKEYLAKKIGEEYIAELLGVWEQFDDIDFEALPNSFVLKCNHDSGSVVICKNKDNFDIEQAKRIINKRIKFDYYWPDREWAYKNIKRKIIAEKYISDGSERLIPYKVFNFMGEPKIIQVIQDDKTSNESIDYFDTDWNLLELRQNFPNSSKHIERPKQLEQILDLSRILSEGIPFVRTDFYILKDSIKFSEFTFYSDSGAERFYPETWDYELGKLIDIGNSL